MTDPTDRPRGKRARQRRDDEALDLRIAGHSYEHIADLMTWTTSSGKPGRWKSKSGVYAACQRAQQRRIDEPDEDLRAMELARLDRLQAANWANALEGDVKAGELVLKLMVRRAKMLGIDARMVAAEAVEAEQRLHDRQVGLVLQVMMTFAAGMGLDSGSIEVRQAIIEALRDAAAEGATPPQLALAPVAQPG